MNKITLTLIATIILSGSSFAQGGRLKVADNYYEMVAYASAAEIYTDLLGSKVDDPKMRARLADCYYQIGQTDLAEEQYRSMIETPEATPEDLYRYAQALKENGKYEESDQWMDKFHILEAEDQRGREFVENKSYLDEIKKQDAYFEVKHLDLNTNDVEFGGYPMGNDKVYFMSNRKKRISIERTHAWNDKEFLDLYVSDRDAEGNLINEKYLPRKTNKKYHEGPLCFSPDGKVVYFTRNNMSPRKFRTDEDGIQNLKIYRAEIDEDGKWINETSLPMNSREHSVGHPTLSADGKTLYFASDMLGTYGGSDLWKVEIFEDGTFGDAINLGPEINTEGQEMFPWVGKDGLLFFASDGHVGLGGLDIFVLIPKEDGSMRKLMNAGVPLNGPNDDFAFALLSDGVSGYFSSNRADGSGSDDIYSFKMINEFKVDLVVKGLVADAYSGEVLPGAALRLLDKKGNEVGTTTANDKGEYEFIVDRNNDYTIEVTKDDYIANSGIVNTMNVPNDVSELEKDLTLSKDSEFSLYALVKGSNTGKPLEGVSMRIKNNKTGERIDHSTGTKGDYLQVLSQNKLGDKLDYTITLEKEGYASKTLYYKTTLNKPGRYDIGAELDLTMIEMDGDLIVINPIYFDYNKSDLRPESKVELDKIVKLMNDHPELEIELGSHTDCRNTYKYNEDLSGRRAKSSADYIKARIKNPGRLTGQGYGEYRLLYDCACEGTVTSTCPEDIHQLNRRTEFKVINPGSLNIQNNSPQSFDDKK